MTTMPFSTAYTAPRGSYPAFTNVAFREDGTVRVIVRSKVTDDGQCGSCGEIVMSREDFDATFRPVVDRVRWNLIINPPERGPVTEDGA